MGGWEVVRAEHLESVWRRSMMSGARDLPRSFPSGLVRDLARRRENQRLQRVRKVRKLPQLMRKIMKRRKKKRSMMRKRNKSSILSSSSINISSPCTTHSHLLLTGLIFHQNNFQPKFVLSFYIHIHLNFWLCIFSRATLC